MYEELKKTIDECDMALIGIGNLASLYPEYSYQDSYSLSEQCGIFSDSRADCQDALLGMYDGLAEILAKKNYFVITTNPDGLVSKSSLNPVRVVAPCGSKDKLQCSCNTGESIIDTPDGYFCGSDVLRCPVCGHNYIPNIYNKTFYNENSYLKQWKLYNKWLQGTLNKRLAIIEIGCDFSMMSLIRIPFERVALINQKAVYYRVNSKFPQITAELKDRMFSIEEEACAFVKKLNSACK